MDYRSLTQVRLRTGFAGVTDTIKDRFHAVRAQARTGAREIITEHQPWLWIAAPLVLIMAYAYHLTWWTWFGLDQTLCFQPFVPFAVAYSIYLNREEIAYQYQVLIAPLDADSPKRHGNMSLAILGCLMIVASAISSLTMLSVVGFVLCVLGVIYQLFGFRIFRVIWQPLLYLMFMIPPPVSTLGILTQRLQIDSTIVAGQIISVFNPGVHVQGVFILLPNFALEVTGPCSGLSIVFPVFVLTAFLALFKHMHLSWAGILLIASVLIAITMNVLRIVVMGLVGGMNPDLATTLHDSNSLVFAGLSFYLTFLVAGAMLRPRRRRRSAFEEDLRMSVQADDENARRSKEATR